MKKVLLLFGICLSILGVYADENVLQSIEIEPVKDTYNIVLVSDKAVDVKKTVQASNKINLALKDIRASKTLNTVYNNVSSVDTVMVEQQGNGVNIFFQAENAEAATVTFDSLIPAAVKPAPKETTSLKLNNPIESYAPIYDETAVSTKTSNLYNKLKENSAIGNIKDSLDEASAEGDGVNKFISYGLLTLLIVAISRLFKRKEPEMKIGLSQQFGGVKEPYAAVPASLQPQYQTSLGAKPFTTVNYGINAYKNENRNPYETTPVQFHNPRLRNFAQQAAPETAVQTATVKPQMQNAASVQTVAKKMTTPVNTAPVNQSNPNVDNLKFLESMTAIYEKSGRHDLARGLKVSLSKNNIN